MNSFLIRGVMLAALTLGVASTTAFAAVAHAGHYEWRSSRQVGPRTPLAAPHRVWVPVAHQVADCDCSMMKMSAADCMMPMQDKHSPSSAG